MVSIRPARFLEASAIHRLRLDAADGLTGRFGYGPWSRISLLNTLRRAITGGTLYVIMTGGGIVGTFTLDRIKSDCYLRSLSVQASRQRQGIGRRAMEAIETLARGRGMRAILSDTYDSAAGAGSFYLKCGYAEISRGVSGGVPLTYYEKVL